MKTPQQIAYLLLDLGFSPALTGFNAIVKFAELWNPQEKVMAYYSITAKHLNATPASIERNMRFSIQKAVQVNPKAMCEFMHYPEISTRYKPSVHEFMAVLHMYLNASDS